MSRKVRDVAKEKISRLFSLVKLAFLLNFTFKIPPRLFFQEQFKPVVSSFSVGEIS